MTQPNQHRNKTVDAVKAATTEHLVNAVQSPIRATDKTRTYLVNRLAEGQARRAEVEGVMLAFQSELDDQLRDIEAIEVALAVLDQKQSEGTTNPIKLQIVGGGEANT